MNNIPDIDFETPMQQAFRTNIMQVCRDVQDLKRKIRSRAKRMNVYPDLLEKELAIKGLAYIFAKDPLKQNRTENIVCEYINKHTDLEVEILPKNSRNSVYLIGGHLTTGNDKAVRFDDRSKTRSLDMLVRGTDGNPWYIAHKYAKASGGSQSNQAKELISTYSEALYCKTEHVSFAMLYYGEYLCKKVPELAAKLPVKDNVFLGTTTSFTKYLLSIK